MNRENDEQVGSMHDPVGNPRELSMLRSTVGIRCQEEVGSHLLVESNKNSETSTISTKEAQAWAEDGNPSGLTAFRS